MSYISFLFILSFIFSQDREANVQGICELANTPDNSGAQVLFEAQTPSAQTDSTYTLGDGSYSIGLNGGLYTVHFSKEGYYPHTMPGQFTFGNDSYTLEPVELVDGGSTQEVSGDVSGFWSSDVLYLVIGDLTVQGSDELTIEAGTRVEFMEQYEFRVYGDLYAIGEEENEIVFTSGRPVPASSDWQGINLYVDYTVDSQDCYDVTDESVCEELVGCSWVESEFGFCSGEEGGFIPQVRIFDYVTIEYAEIGIYSTGSGGNHYNYFNDTILNSTIQYGYMGIKISSAAPTISNNTFNENTYGIYSSDTQCRPTISYNHFSQNDYQMYMNGLTAGAIIEENTLYSNFSTGGMIDGWSYIFRNNFIQTNYDGVSFYGSGEIYGNTITDVVSNYAMKIYCNCDVFNNVVTNSGGYAVYLSNDNLTFRNNTITDNEYKGLSVWNAASIKNNIITDNGQEDIYFHHSGGQPFFTGEIGYNNIWDDDSNVYGGAYPAGLGTPLNQNNNGTACDTYYNISEPPMFDFEVGSGGNYSWELNDDIVTFYLSYQGWENHYVEVDNGEACMSNYEMTWTGSYYTVDVNLYYCGQMPINWFVFNDDWQGNYFSHGGIDFFDEPVGPEFNFGDGEEPDLYDYSLSADSPCIDAGHPGSEQDADLTTVDQGAFPYYQTDLPAPSIDFTASATLGTGSLPVQFSPVNTGGPITSFLWDFGDGSSSSSAYPVHNYTVSDAPESFSVSLTVEGPGGSDFIIYNDLISVTPMTYPPTCGFSSNTQISFGDIQFTSQSSGEIDDYDWSFGDGESSSEANPLHSYQSPGVYSVSLTVSGPNGSTTETKENYIQILEMEAVLAGFEVDSDVGVAPHTVNITNTTIGTIESYSWSFGDGGESSSENPIYTYEQAGIYDLSLLASGPLNSDNASASITVFSEEPAILSISDVPNDNGGYVLIEFLGSGYDIIDSRTEFYTAEMNIDGNWVTASFSPPYGEQSYGFIVHTIEDSSSTSDGVFEFRVVANMDEGVFISESVSGYSADNIAPGVPEDLMLSGMDEDIDLSWSYSEDIDFAYHAVTDLDFSQSYTIENSISIPMNGSYNEYHVNSVDTHDNISGDSKRASAYHLHYGANLMSFSVLPEDNSVTNLLSGMDISCIFGEGTSACYNEANGWMGNISDIQSDNGYWILTTEDQILPIVGDDHVINSFNLNYGANLTSYSCNQSGDINELITNESIIKIIGEGVAAIRNASGWAGSLAALDPGSGYWFISDAETQLSYDCPEQSYEDSREQLSYEHEKNYIQSTRQAFYFFIDIDKAEPGDLIEAYNGDILVGSRVWSGEYTDIPVMGQDSQGETLGYCQEGQTPSFKLKKQSGEEYMLQGDIPSWDDNEVYIAGSASVVELTPESYSLGKAYPNPFNPSTTIGFTVPVKSNVSLYVYDVSGRKIRQLTNKEHAAGYHSVSWDASDMPSGVYLIKMQSGSFTDTRKVMLIK